MILREMEHRFEASQKYQVALAEWEEKTNEPEGFPGYNRNMYMSFKDAITKANKNLGYANLSDIPDSAWAKIIFDEMEAAVMTTTPSCS